MSIARPRSWFATLRRDRTAFAVLALIALMIQVLQPLAASAAVSAGGMPVICTAMAVDDDPANSPVSHESCARCIAGACRLALGDLAILPGEPAWITAAALISPPWTPVAAARPDPSPPGLPPGIRAPPASI